MLKQSSNKRSKTQLLSLDVEIKDESVKIVPNNLLEETQKDWMRKLWNDIQEVNADKVDKGKAPLTKLDLDKPQENLEIQSRYNMVEPSNKNSSKASSLK